MCKLVQMSDNACQSVMLLVQLTMHIPQHLLLDILEPRLVPGLLLLQPHLLKRVEVLLN